MSKPPDFDTWPLRARASLITLERTRGEMIKAIAAELEFEYETDRAAGNERVPSELLALVYARLELYR